MALVEVGFSHSHLEFFNVVKNRTESFSPPSGYYREEPQLFELWLRLQLAKFKNIAILTYIAMQQNIKKSMAKANKERSQTIKAEKKKNSKKRSKSNLLRMLSSNIVTENKATNSKASPSGSSPLARSCPSTAEVTFAPEAVPQPLELQGQQRSPSNKPPTKACPLCGSSIQLELFDQHMQEELVALAAIDDDDDDSGWEQFSLPPRPLASSLHNQYQQRPAPLLPLAPRDSKVYILGGTPAMAVPRNPKKLKPLPPEYRRQIKPVKAYNYYADGGGNMDGDEIGLDGFANVGVGWEGVGATTF